MKATSVSASLFLLHKFIEENFSRPSLMFGEHLQIDYFLQLNKNHN